MSAPAASADPRPGESNARRGLTAGHFYLAFGGGALIVAALSLLIPSTPSYDPWAWLVWGREILHINLQTIGGPTWKPLPVLFTTVFALFGKAQPDLWLMLARAGALMAAIMAFKVSMRLTRMVGAATGASRAIVAPAVLAGAIALISLVGSGGFVSSNALGYSEGLLTALVLIAIERHLDGKPRQAFAVAFFAALDRPEIWLFWGPYGLWLAWKDPGARKLVFGLFALIPVLWFLPEYWGSGHFFRGVTRAQHPRRNSPAFAPCPFCTELSKHAFPEVLSRMKVAAAIGVLAAGVKLLRGGWRVALRAPQDERARGMVYLVLAGLVGLGWWVLIAILTQAGFSGNDRYLVLGAALIEIAGAVSFGWAAYALAGLARRRLAAARATPQPRLIAGASALMALVFLVVPNLVTNSLIDVQRTHRALVYQAHLREDAAKAIAELGGPGRVLGCGTVMTEGFQVPMLAWTLGVHTARVEAPPAILADPGPAPNVIFQTRSQRGYPLLPVVRAWSTTHYVLVAHVRTFRVYAQCDGKVAL